MDIKRLYEEIGGDYDGVAKRFGSVAMIERFAVKFLSDDSAESLRRAFESGDVDSAFRSAHTLKGLALNLGFTELGENAAVLTEILRKKTFIGSEEAYKNTLRAYDRLSSAIKRYSDK